MSEDPSVLILALGAVCSDETVASLEEGDHVLGHQQGPECVDHERLNQGLRGHVGKLDLAAAAGVKDTRDCSG